jgi:ubiquinone/menaquinone biosynthesis C-methylase UbiE
MLLNDYHLTNISDMISDAPVTNPTTRFSNRVENYVKYRPGYPAEVFKFLETDLGLTKNSTIADMGSGTGLFAEPLLEKGYSVICIEPNEEMRKAGEARLGKYKTFASRFQKAEATGLADHSVDMITVAQAFHWLEPEDTKQEFTRILKKDGKVVLAWNIQKKGQPFMDAYRALKDEHCFEQAIPKRIDLKKIEEFFAPNGFEKTVFNNEQMLDFDGLKGQLLSSSYIPLPGHPSYETMISTLVQLFVKYNVNGFVKMEFETMVFHGKMS